MKTMFFSALMILAASVFAGGDFGKIKVDKGTLARFDYSDFDKVLKTYVRDGWVDYEGLKADPKDLNSYLARAATVTRAEFDTWSSAESFAFYINLYNGTTLRLIADNYPLDSIKDIGSYFKGPWKQEVVDLFGEKTTLDHLEHGILRKMGDPRIHFAINCASIGCPLIAGEAYTAEKLDKQLDAATRGFLKETDKNRFDLKSATVEVSPIFNWFSADFNKKSGSVQAFIENFVDEDLRPLVRDSELTYTDYDWKLNDIKNR